MGGTHTAGSGNCMVRIADMNVCGRAEYSRRQREKRDAKNRGFWPLGLDTRAWESGARQFQSGQSCCGVRVLGVMIEGVGVGGLSAAGRH